MEVRNSLKASSASVPVPARRCCRSSSLGQTVNVAIKLWNLMSTGPVRPTLLETASNLVPGSLTSPCVARGVSQAHRRTIATCGMPHLHLDFRLDRQVLQEEGLIDAERIALCGGGHARRGLEDEARVRRVSAVIVQRRHAELQPLDVVRLRVCRGKRVSRRPIIMTWTRTAMRYATHKRSRCSWCSARCFRRARGP